MISMGSAMFTPAILERRLRAHHLCLLVADFAQLEGGFLAIYDHGYGMQELFRIGVVVGVRHGDGIRRTNEVLYILDKPHGASRLPDCLKPYRSKKDVLAVWSAQPKRARSVILFEVRRDVVRRGPQALPCACFADFAKCIARDAFIG